MGPFSQSAVVGGDKNTLDEIGLLSLRLGRGSILWNAVLVDGNYKIPLGKLGFLFLPTGIPMKKVFFLSMTGPKGVEKSTNTYPNTEHRTLSGSMLERNGKELSHSSEQASPGIWTVFLKESVKKSW